MGVYFQDEKRRTAVNKLINLARWETLVDSSDFGCFFLYTFLFSILWYRWSGDSLYDDFANFSGNKILTENILSAVFVF
jgi:hypothetical protein